MKFLNINATISVKPQFSGEVIKAGTPLDISGAIANSDAAVGIVASDTAVGAESIAIVTEGTIDLTELTASYGSALTDECIAALKGITFLYGGKAVVPSGGGGGEPVYIPVYEAGGEWHVGAAWDDPDDVRDAYLRGDNLQVLLVTGNMSENEAAVLTLQSADTVEVDNAPLVIGLTFEGYYTRTKERMQVTLGFLFTNTLAVVQDLRPLNVTLTPTAPDFSGTMDKTVAEIYEAFLYGRDIYFSVAAQGRILSVQVGEVSYTDGVEYPSFNVDLLIGPEVTGSGYALLHVFTSATDDGTKNTYSTTIFPLTTT